MRCRPQLGASETTVHDNRDRRNEMLATIGEQGDGSEVKDNRDRHEMLAEIGNERSLMWE